MRNHQRIEKRGGGGDALPPAHQGFALFWDIHFLLTDPKIFLKAPKYTNFEG